MPAFCPCGSGRPYADCCGRRHAGEAAPGAAAQMRSRCSAYALELRNDLLTTWHPDTRPAALALEAPPGARTTRLGLQVKRQVVTGPDRAEVEFIAR
ncbi:YchJ family protein [Rehaibacterium terrae]|jgi:SEC-C motif-containing protein|uniref:SEC-C motif-containing protein n=1 Tax=Rehaibacterium terrae TaxID=1341696 RepID=A0A7W8DE75_9GAMM|nr:SEC-C motif-containing protein [Rehaibacterium terrae]